MYSRILTCDYEFVSPWWDEVSLNAKDLVSERCRDWGCQERSLQSSVCKDDKIRGIKQMKPFCVSEIGDRLEN